jgi:hypothetical protein
VRSWRRYPAARRWSSAYTRGMTSRNAASSPWPHRISFSVTLPGGSTMVAGALLSHPGGRGRKTFEILYFRPQKRKISQAGVAEK